MPAPAGPPAAARYSGPLPVRTPLLLLSLCAAAPAAGEGEAARVALKPRRNAETAPLAPAPLLRLTLGAQAPAGAALPPGLSPAARFAALDLFGGPAWLAFDAPEGARALGLLWTRGAEEPARGRAQPGGDGFWVRFDHVPCAGGRVDVLLAYARGELREATLAPAEHRRGRTLLGGAMREVLLVDGDADGRYDGAADRWVALRADRLHALPSIGMPALMLLAEPQVPFEEDGRAFTVRDVAADGSSCVLALGAPGAPAARVLERRRAEVREEHFARFRREEAALARERGLDLARPRASSPAPWPPRTLAEAKAEAQRAGKPLLVHFYSEANAYGWLAEYFTYPDREVDALLKGCVLAAVDVDKDPERTFQALELHSLPTVVPFDAAGARVVFVLRVRAVGGEVAELEGERAIAGWHRPQEFALNLRRALGR